MILSTALALATVQPPANAPPPQPLVRQVKPDIHETDRLIEDLRQWAEESDRRFEEMMKEYEQMKKERREMREKREKQLMVEQEKKDKQK
ncbi:MAG: hypothetical protein ACOVT5_10595 [Armatimonadaceae bacterium]